MKKYPPYTFFQKLGHGKTVFLHEKRTQTQIDLVVKFIKMKKHFFSKLLQNNFKRDFLRSLEDSQKCLCKQRLSPHFFEIILSQHLTSRPS